MTSYLRPGVFVEETLNPLPPALGSNSQSVAAFIGVIDRGPTAVTAVSSWNQFTNLYGNYGNNNLVHLAVLLFFSNGGGTCYIRRTVGTGATSASRTFNDRAGSPASTLRLSSASVGAWGNTVNVSIQTSASGASVDLIVYLNGTASSNIVERFTDLTMGATDDRYLVSIINAQSNYLTAEDTLSAATGSDRLPVVAINQYLVSGSDGSTVTSSTVAGDITAFDVVKNSLILNAPDTTDSSAVNSLLAYAEARGDVFVIIDPAQASVTAQLSTAATYTPSSYGAVYHPRIVLNDPTSTISGTVLTVSPGGAIAGIYASTDASRGVFKAPAGLSARIAGAVSVAPHTNAELDSMNSAVAPVNAINYVTGSGIVVMGARTLKGGKIDKYVPVRRTLIYLRKSMTELTQFAVFEPNDDKLWRRINASLDGFLRDFWRQGGLRGTNPSQAFFVKCDSDNNSQSSIDSGYVNIEVGVALQRPAEFVVIKISQFDGGTTVTVA